MAAASPAFPSNSRDGIDFHFIWCKSKKSVFRRKNEKVSSTTIAFAYMIIKKGAYTSLKKL